MNEIMEQVKKEDSFNLESKKEVAFKPVVFISESRGLQVMDEKGNIICKFSTFATMHPKKGYINKGHYLCLKKAIYDKLVKLDEDGRSLYGLNRAYKIVKKLPIQTDMRGNVVRGVSTAGGNSEPYREYTDEQVAMTRELGSMEGKYYKLGTTEFKENIKEASRAKITQRINELKIALGIV